MTPGIKRKISVAERIVKFSIEILSSLGQEYAEVKKIPVRVLMGENRLIDTFSVIIGGGVLLASFFIFFRNTSEFSGSLVAAIMTAALAWSTYIVIRWLILANRD